MLEQLACRCSFVNFHLQTTIEEIFERFRQLFPWLDFRSPVGGDQIKSSEGRLVQVRRLAFNHFWKKRENWRKLKEMRMRLKVTNRHDPQAPNVNLLPVLLSCHNFWRPEEKITKWWTCESERKVKLTSNKAFQPWFLASHAPRYWHRTRSPSLWPFHLRRVERCLTWCPDGWCPWDGENLLRSAPKKRVFHWGKPRRVGDEVVRLPRDTQRKFVVHSWQSRWRRQLMVH